ncbi:hypothetical protein [Micromonospora sp. B9E7]|uniref:hypothetical protein n=1 Tax=Micromonospora sp. B9E7 TaxID=3153574 RepID=UPI00325E68FA
MSAHVIPGETSMHVGLTGSFILARSAEGGWVGNLENRWSRTRCWDVPLPGGEFQTPG